MLFPPGVFLRRFWRQVELVGQHRVIDRPPLRRAVLVLLDPARHADSVAAMQPLDAVGVRCLPLSDCGATVALTRPTIHPRGAPLGPDWDQTHGGGASALGNLAPVAREKMPLAAASPNGEGRNRTGDTTIFSRVLYQLSYLAVAAGW